MTDIRFLNQLGDNLEEATRRDRQKQPRKRRRLLIGLAVLATAATGIAAASQILSDPDSLAASSIGCYTASGKTGNVTVVDADGEPPVAVCARIRAEVEKLPPARLVACADDEAVAVFPGTSCEEAGLEPIPTSYRLSVGRVERLATAIGTIEKSADCIPPEQLADRALATLQDQGWEGWQAEIRGDENLPCGQVSSPGGNGDRSLSGALNTADSIVYVFRSFPRSIEGRFFSKDSPIAALIKASGRSCLTPAELKKQTRIELDSARFKVSVEGPEPLPESDDFGDARNHRYESGCAVIRDVWTPPDETGRISFEVRIAQKKD